MKGNGPAEWISIFVENGLSFPIKTIDLFFNFCPLCTPIVKNDLVSFSNRSFRTFFLDSAISC